MIKNAVLSFVMFLFLISCVGNTQKTESATSLLTPVDKYSSYVVDSVFDSEQFLKDMSGTWVAFKHEKDGEYYPNYYDDVAFREEFARYFYIEIVNDTISFDKYKMPIECKRVEATDMNKFARESFNVLRLKDTSSSELDFVYQIRGQNKLYYSSYWKQMTERGNSLPYFENSGLGVPIWCFPNYIVINNYGYYWFYEKGQPNNEGIVGMPSNQTNRFIVNRVYKNCTIEESAYKLIEDFPKGTEGLLFYSDEPSEPDPYFAKSSFELYSTVYDWKNEDELIVSVGHGRNCTFVFEFNQVGDDVHIKYWNDVVFPFEEGYQGH